MARITPYKGANTAQYYIPEVTPGVTPTSPAWLPLRYTSGVLTTTKDSLVSNELDGSRETSSIRLGSNQLTGEYAIELSARSQDDFLAGALSSTWSGVIASVPHTITVDPALKKYTSVDAITNIEVGDLIAFTGLTGNNSKPFIVTAHDGLSVTGDGINYDLTAESAASATLHYPEHLMTGSQCKTFSILTWFAGECGGSPSYLLSKGVEVSGFSLEMAVNAAVTGSFPMIGTDQEILTALPAGSTFPPQPKPEMFSSVDVSAFNGSAALRLVNTFSITNDNSASPQYELGDDGVSFIEKARAANTFSLAAMLYDMTMYERFLNEEENELTAILNRDNDAMSFTLKRAKFTAAPIEIGGPESVTLSIEGQSQGNKEQSSIVIQRLSIA